MDGGGGSSGSQVALDQASITIENPIEANTDYTIPLNYTVGSEDLEVFYCGNKLQKDVDYIEVGNVGIISNKIQFKTAIGDLDMSGISGFEDFKETLQFAVTGKTALGQINELETKISNKVDKTQSFNGNLNDLKTTGFYYANGDTQNIPFAGYSYYVTVIANPYADYVLQQATRVTTTLANMKIQQRQCFNGTWTAWQDV